MHHLRRGHDGAGIAGADEPGDYAVAHQPRGDANRGVLLAARRRGRGVVHGDDFAGVNDFDRKTGRVVLCQKLADAILLPDQNDRNAVLRSGLDGPFNFDCGRVVAAHRIDCDFDVGHEELFLGGLDDFPFFVKAAMRTGAMRHAQFVAIGALGKRARRQMIVCAAAIAPRFRMSSFWIWHMC